MYLHVAEACCVVHWVSLVCVDLLMMAWLVLMMVSLSFAQTWVCHDLEQGLKLPCCALIQIDLQPTDWAPHS